MASSPSISVVMPTYRESTQILSRTVDSVLNQTFQDLELVVIVDDPTREDSIALFDAYRSRDSRVRVHVNRANLGVWPSYNQGVRLCRGHFIAIQDADDVSLPTRLETLHRFMIAHPDVDVVGCGLTYVDGTTLRPLLVRRYPEDAGTAIRRYCPIAHATTLRKADLHARFGYYDESSDVRHAADYELWFRWYLQGVRMANISDVLYEYHQSRSNFKAQNVKAILRDTVFIKRRYRARMGFGMLDRLWLWAEEVALRLPARAIVALFYIVNRARS